MRTCLQERYSGRVGSGKKVVVRLEKRDTRELLLGWCRRGVTVLAPNLVGIIISGGRDRPILWIYEGDSWVIILISFGWRLSTALHLMSAFSQAD